MTGREVRFVQVAQDDVLAVPLLAELAAEYSQRYGGAEDAHLHSLQNYPAHEFVPPHGGLLIGVDAEGSPVTGGAFRRFGDVDGEPTAELKRIWTSRNARRQGLATMMMVELEAEIARRGYRRIYLMTGDRQPEAEGLYASLGYQRLDAPLPTQGPVYPIAFVKALTREVSA
ncbi:GNAT family N-acetyltransferase [Mycobacterium sp. MS1601]|uniref:GNAT family N-acetyltransferase n=1 Tax=Mycobacterium sp. MS1601 TaxID=1936029 RepID=UPI0009794388|nr:GNAT family N-acetyltransferase [Mycobacterium sp. MS1601]AQA03822.1 GNAT family N-acetyltransferase [Mycobacterium sp. MS1601]